jgi:3-oxoacyl-[acyl-carrier protein] reductase
MVKYDFSDKVVLITGGSRGIGRAIANKFSETGAKVFITYKSRVDHRYFKSRGIIYYKCDSANTQRIKTVINKIIGKFGRIDVLVYNAGITKDTLILRMRESDWDDVINTNLRGAFVFSREVCKSMVKNHRGKIIFIGSIVSFSGNPGQSNYVASKAGINGLARAMAKEFAPYNIQVNVVACGYVETDMTAALTEAQKQAILNYNEKRAPAKPDQVADFVAFLASDDSDLITGQVIPVEAKRLKKEEREHFKIKK